MLSAIKPLIYLAGLSGDLSSGSATTEGLYQALTKKFSVTQLSVIDLAEQSVQLADNTFSVYADVIWYADNDLYRSFKPSFINIAYSMFEGNKLPLPMVQALNNSFDMIIVPNQFLKEVYKRNGVTKPLFIIPLPMASLSKLPLISTARKAEPITFGFLGGLSERKGIFLLLQAFTQKYGNNPLFKLKIHKTIKITESA